MKEHERKQLLERVDRDGGTVGVRIPEEFDLQGESIALRAFVFEVDRLETVTAGDRDRVRAVAKQLRRERLDRRRTIEAGEISFDEGERLARDILGIDRALNALRTLDGTDLEADASAQRAADQKRWLSFLKQVLGHDEGRRPRP